MNSANLFDELWKLSLSKELTAAFIVRKYKISWTEAERLLQRINEKRNDLKNSDPSDDPKTWIEQVQAMYRDDVIECQKYVSRYVNALNPKGENRLKAKVSLSLQEKRMIRKFYQECPYDHEIDHIVPISDGGKHVLSNLRYLQKKDNRERKLNLLPKDFVYPHCPLLRSN